WLQTERSQTSSNVRARAAHDGEIGASTASASPAAARGEARNAEPAHWRGSTSVNVFRDLRSLIADQTNVSRRSRLAAAWPVDRRDRPWTRRWVPMRAMTTWVTTVIALFLFAAAVGGLIARSVWIEGRIANLTARPKLMFDEANAGLPPKAGRLRVVLIGDSSFARWLKGSLSDRWQFVNRGVGGEPTAQIAQRFDTDALALSPDVIVLWAGINDLVAAEFLDPASRRAAVDTTFETLVDLARRGADRGARVILATIAPPSHPE